jgi:N-acetylmuramoyl-L-alanine amidase
METTGTSEEKIKPKRSWEIVYQLFFILLVGFTIATLYTAWTPGYSPTIIIPPKQSMSLPETLPTRQIHETTKAENTATPSQPRIGIVAGHWRNDSGAVCSDGLTEVEINLQTASLVQKLLKEKGYQVDLLEEFDPDLIDYNADALVSIHADSCEYINNNATGFKVAASMANINPERSALLTACLRSRYGEVTGLPVHSLSVTPDMTSYHAFGEIGENTAAAIIEIGFLNLDRELLTNQNDLVALGIVNGILCYLNNEEIGVLRSPEQP